MVSRSIKFGILPLILVSVIILGIIYLYWPYVSTIVLAGTLAVVLYSPYQRLCRHVSEKLAATIVIILSVILLMVLLFFVVAVFVNFSGYFGSMSLTITHWLNNISGYGLLKGSMLGSAVSITQQFVGNIVFGLASGVPAYCIQILFFLLSLFLFLTQGEKVIQEVFSVIPDHLRSATVQLRKDVVNTLYATYVVNLQICLITFVIALPFFTILGSGQIIPYATLTAVSQLVPTIGPLFILVFIGLYALALGDLTTAIIIIIAGCVLFLFLPGSILKPKMMGKRVSLPASMLMIAIIGGITAVGISGVILGPLFAALFVSGYRLMIAQMKTIMESESG
ncbi:MAG: AI-2E family transporter [Methanospirillum sp.]|nr:AI-2E family transporter [Methanospirillum sp.]